jgi:2-hydroxy-3-keto-5-methylthiopentenyl-1-phosphate phosphatase
MMGVDAEVITNRAVFGDPFMSVEFPETPPICAHDDGDICGTCKVEHVRRSKARGKFVIYIGDGATDVRPALESDMVFARRALAERMPATNKEFVPFETFDEIRERLEELLRT